MNPENIYIILSHPFAADNIGAAARAMKNMGFSKLRLVSPRRNWKRRAKILARGASDILDSAGRFKNLQSALEDLNWTFGTTARIGEKRGKFFEFEDFIPAVSEKSASLKIGIIFGRESKGLTNEEIECCDQLVSIPSDDAYPSLNLAQAVMAVVFTLGQIRLHKKSKTRKISDLSGEFLLKADIQSTLHHFAKALECIGFYGGKKGRLEPILRVTEAIFKRAGMLERESQMLKGVSARIIQRTLNVRKGNSHE